MVFVKRFECARDQLTFVVVRFEKPSKIFGPKININLKDTFFALPISFVTLIFREVSWKSKNVENFVKIAEAVRLF